MSSYNVCSNDLVHSIVVKPCSADDMVYMKPKVDKDDFVFV